jgi:hypothetical protein
LKAQESLRSATPPLCWHKPKVDPEAFRGRPFGWRAGAGCPAARLHCLETPLCNQGFATQETPKMVQIVDVM